MTAADMDDDAELPDPDAVRRLAHQVDGQLAAFEDLRALAGQERAIVAAKAPPPAPSPPTEPLTIADLEVT